MNQILSNNNDEYENRNNKNQYYNNRNTMNKNYMSKSFQRNSYYDNYNYNNNRNNTYYNDRYSSKNRYDPSRRKKSYYYHNGQVREKINLVKIVRIFAVFLIVYGLIIIGQSAYALNSSEYKPKDVPKVSIDKMGKEVTVQVETTKPIKEISYKWNDGEETKSKGNGKNNIEQKIDIPNGNNVLNITVTDHYGNKTYYQRQYIYESKDSIKPNIETSVSGTKITITVTDETRLAYITYKWNEEEEERYDVPKGQNLVTFEIEVEPGKNTLTINAIDGDDNRTQFSKMIIGDTKPEISISTEGNEVVINAKDDEGISKLKVSIDDEVTEQDTENNTEINAKIPVSEGTHDIKATVVNVNGLKASKEITADI